MNPYKLHETAQFVKMKAEKKQEVKNVKYCLGVDVAAVDSMYCLMSENGELIFPPTKFKRTLSGFKKVIEMLGNINQSDIMVILE